MWRTRNQKYQVPQEKRCDPKWTRCWHVWAFKEMRTVFSYPLKRTKQETYFRKHRDVHFCCSYIRMTPPRSGLLSRWIYIYFFNEKACVHDFLSLFIYIYLYSKLMHRLQTNTTFTLQLNCKWPNYSGHQVIEFIFAVDLRLRFTFL